MSLSGRLPLAGDRTPHRPREPDGPPGATTRTSPAGSQAGRASGPSSGEGEGDLRRRTRSVVVTTSMLIAGLGAGAPAALANQRHDNFTLNGRITDVDRQDNGREGWSEGDRITFRYDFRNEGDGDGVCRIVKLDRRDREFKADCRATFDLDHGRLDLEGTITDDDFRHHDVSLDVVDGTGRYRNAGGTATLRKADHDDRGRFKVDVELD